MPLIEKENAKIAVRDATKRLPTMAIRAMHAIEGLEEVEAIPKETVRAVLKEAEENAYDLGNYALGYGAAVEHIREKLL